MMSVNFMINNNNTICCSFLTHTLKNNQKTYLKFSLNSSVDFCKRAFLHEFETGFKQFKPEATMNFDKNTCFPGKQACVGMKRTSWKSSLMGRGDPPPETHYCTKVSSWTHFIKLTDILHNIPTLFGTNDVI